MNSFFRHTIYLLLPFLPLSAFAQENSEDLSQSRLREDAVVLENPLADEHISSYPFLNIKANRIKLNGDNWERLREKFAKTDSAAFTIVHIGDSHIQADVLTGTVRDNLQKKYGNGGRGIIIPFKIAGSNEPYSYTFTTDKPVVSAKLLSVPWLSDMRFTGASFTPKAMKYSISLNTEVVRNPDGSPFNKIRLYSRGRFFIDNITDEKGVKLIPSVIPSSGYVDINLPVSVKGIKLSLHSFENVSFSGASLTNGNSGIVYHAIGNNGATFSNYNRIENFGKDVASLSPDLIIISLGTNDAFGKISDESLIEELNYLLKQLKDARPKVKFLLTTPMECQRTFRSYRKRRKGSRRRYSYTRSQTVNTRVATVADAIRKYAAENKIPLYDFYEVAGGNGASSRWVSSKIMSSDRIHLSFPGYRVAGDLFTEALRHSLINRYSESDQSSNE